MANLRVDKITSTETFETTGSVQFGNDNALKISANSGFDLTSNDFTMECWVYMNSVESFQTLLLYTVDGTEDDTVWQFDITSTQLRFVGYVSNSSEVYGSNFSFGSGTWYHVAATRTNDLVRLFVDGDLIGTHPFAATLDTEASAELNIGYRNNQGTMDREVFGHLSNIRVIKGKALYTANFKPPMRELEVTPETTLLCCQSKTDASLEKTSKTITVLGDAVASELTPGILTPVPKAGGGSAIKGSVEFSGRADGYLYISEENDFDLGADDFTIEYWYNEGNDDRSEKRTLYMRNRADSSPQQWIIGHTNDNSGRIFFQAFDSSGNTVGGGAVTSADASNPTGKRDHWRHLAVVRNGTTVTIYLDGVASGSLSYGTTAIRGDQNDLYIGYDPATTGRNFRGFLSNIRIVKGTALYTEDFIPPTRELKKVPGTVLLCCQDPDDVTTEATGKTIIPFGDLAGPDSSRSNIGQNLVTNGTFDSDTSGWTVLNTGTFTASSGQATLSDSDGTGTSPVAYQEITTFVPGKMYVFQFDTVANREAYGYVTTTAGSNTLGYSVSEAFPAYTGSLAFTRYIKFVATQSTMQINFSDGSGSDFDVTVDNVKVYQIDPGSAGSNFTPQVGDDRKVTFEGVTKVNSDAYFYLPTGDTASRETTGTYNAGTRGIFGGGFSSPTTHHDTIQYINIASQGHATDAGDLTVSRYGNAALASATRAVWAGGTNPSPLYSNTIDAVEIMSTGNAFDFGDLYAQAYYPGGVSNRTRGIYAGGYQLPSPSGFRSDIGYITISSKGNTNDFGDLITAKNSFSTFNSPTRGCFAGGATPSKINSIEYVTIATTGNASDFGDLSQARNYGGGCGSAIRGLVGGGSTPTVVNTIDYVTISAMGNAADFGDLTTVRAEVAGCSSATRGVFAGSWSPSKTNTIDFVTIQTTSNAVNFGDLVNIGVMQEMGTSNGHGGLG